MRMIIISIYTTRDVEVLREVKKNFSLLLKELRRQWELVLHLVVRVQEMERVVSDPSIERVVVVSVV